MKCNGDSKIRIRFFAEAAFTYAEFASSKQKNIKHIKRCEGLTLNNSKWLSTGEEKVFFLCTNNCQFSHSYERGIVPMQLSKDAKDNTGQSF